MVRLVCMFLQLLVRKKRLLRGTDVAAEVTQFCVENMRTKGRRRCTGCWGRRTRVSVEMWWVGSWRSRQGRSGRREGDVTLIQSTVLEK